jgi:hypothetical protein
VRAGPWCRGLGQGQIVRGLPMLCPSRPDVGWGGVVGWSPWGNGFSSDLADTGKVETQEKLR